MRYVRSFTVEPFFKGPDGRIYHYCNSYHHWSTTKYKANKIRQCGRHYLIQKTPKWFHVYATR